MTFHDVLFPTAISRGAQGGPERRTEIVAMASGREERNARWADSRRVYNAGWGVKSLDDIERVVAFFEERRGRLHGFRWRDHADHKSCAPSAAPAASDQVIGTGDGVTARFQLAKRYGTGASAWLRTITKPVTGSVTVAVAGAVVPATDVTVDTTTGLITFAPSAIPPAGARITAGFFFDVPVRFDTDKLEISLTGVASGSIPSIPIVEIRP